MTKSALGSLVFHGAILPLMGVRTVFCDPSRYGYVQK
jgi:hypothetical protein